METIRHDESEDDELTKHALPCYDNPRLLPTFFFSLVVCHVKSAPFRAYRSIQHNATYLDRLHTEKNGQFQQESGCIGSGDRSFR